MSVNRAPGTERVKARDRSVIYLAPKISKTYPSILGLGFALPHTNLQTSSQFTLHSRHPPHLATACASDSVCLSKCLYYYYFAFALCCHSNETQTPIAHPPNSAQLWGTPYHSPKLHPGPCNSAGMRYATRDRLRHRHA